MYLKKNKRDLKPASRTMLELVMEQDLYSTVQNNVIVQGKQDKNIVHIQCELAT